MKGNFAQILFGGFLVFAGFLFLLDQFVPGLRVERFFSLIGPAFLFFLGFNFLVKRIFIWAFFFFFLSIAIFVDIFNLLPFNIWNLWPVFLILAGFSIIFKIPVPKKVEIHSQNTNTDRLNDSILFWGSDKTIKSENFSGGSVTVLFGGGNYDLRNVKFAKNAVLDLNVIFGGVDVIVNKEDKVLVNGNGIMGGVENRVQIPEKERDLTINAVAIFGGIEVKNNLD